MAFCQSHSKQRELRGRFITRSAAGKHLVSKALNALVCMSVSASLSVNVVLSVCLQVCLSLCQSTAVRATCFPNPRNGSALHRNVTNRARRWKRRLFTITPLPTSTNERICKHSCRTTVKSKKREHVPSACTDPCKTWVSQKNNHRNNSSDSRHRQTSLMCTRIGVSVYGGVVHAHERHRPAQHDHKQR